MLGMARPLRYLLQDERLKELRLQAKFRWFTVWLNTLGNMPPALAPAVTFIVYAIKARVTNSSPLNTSQVFTSLALINLVTTPALELITSFPLAASSRLFTGTIRQNICDLKVSTLDEAWYRSVLHACLLDDVILGLTHGDNTCIEGLSGGQKQRIVLARALYQRPQLVLFDDVLSALDTQTEIQIMTRLFGRDGLMSNLGATVIFVTHSTRWETIADDIITLDGSRNATRYSKTPDFQAEVFSNDHPSGRDSPQAIVASNGRLSEDRVLSSADVISNPQHGSDSRDYLYYFKSVRWPTILALFLSAAIQTICLYMSQAILNWWAADHGSNEAKWLPTYLILAIGNGVMYGCTT
ncbi:hypothetical protein EAF04_002676 [Stromatinia cepivora]|nr:hypothetical protein EAF04_002676 [Stromatinia cepivora]